MSSDAKIAKNATFDAFMKINPGILSILNNRFRVSFSVAVIFPDMHVMVLHPIASRSGMFSILYFPCFFSRFLIAVTVDLFRSSSFASSVSVFSGIRAFVRFRNGLIATGRYPGGPMTWPGPILSFSRSGRSIPPASA